MTVRPALDHSVTMTLPLPPHVDLERISDLWVERAGELRASAPKWRVDHQISAASEDPYRILAFGIDCQISFCHPAGGLFVPGAVEDSARTVRWIYQNLDRLTGLAFSLDTHELHQVFHPAFWRSASGMEPEPFTIITSEDVERGTWIPRANRDLMIEYTRKLEATGRYSLTIWPYHGLLGGLSSALLPAFAEAMCFHSFVRDTAPKLVVKGQHPLSEMYSVLSAEVKDLGGESVGGFDEALVEHVLSFDRVYVFGQASSHCVLATLEDLRARLEAIDAALLKKIVILEDAMSPVPAPLLDPLPDSLDFPAQARRRIDRLVEAGMGRARTTDPVAPGS